MAEQTKEMNIRLHVYDEEIDVTIKREDEALYRAAAAYITKRYNVYAHSFNGKKSNHTIALMVMVDIALRLERELRRNDTAPFDDVIATLTDELEQVLNNKQ